MAGVINFPGGIYTKPSPYPELTREEMLKLGNVEMEADIAAFVGPLAYTPGRTPDATRMQALPTESGRTPKYRQVGKRGAARARGIYANTPEQASRHERDPIKRKRLLEQSEKTGGAHIEWGFNERDTMEAKIPHGTTAAMGQENWNPATFGHEYLHQEWDYSDKGDEAALHGLFSAPNSEAFDRQFKKYVKLDDSRQRAKDKPKRDRYDILEDILTKVARKQFAVREFREGARLPYKQNHLLELLTPESLEPERAYRMSRGSLGYIKNLYKNR